MIIFEKLILDEKYQTVHKARLAATLSLFVM